MVFILKSFFFFLNIDASGISERMEERSRVGEGERGRRERQRSSEFNFPFISLNFQDTIKNQCWAEGIYGLVVGHLPVMFKEL